MEVTVWARGNLCRGDKCRSIVTVIRVMRIPRIYKQMRERLGRLFSLTEYRVAKISLLLSLIGLVFAFWQHSQNQPAVFSELRGFRVYEEAERKADGAWGEPRWVCIDLDLFFANAGRQPIGVEYIDLEPIGLRDGVELQRFAKPFKLDLADSKEIHLSYAVKYTDFPKVSGVTFVMKCVDGRRIILDNVYVKRVFHPPDLETCYVVVKDPKKTDLRFPVIFRPKRRPLSGHLEGEAQ